MAKMASFLKGETGVDRNEIQAFVQTMGIQLCAGEVEDLFYRLKAGSAPTLGTDAEMSVKTDPDADSKVPYFDLQMTV